MDLSVAIVSTWTKRRRGRRNQEATAGLQGQGVGRPALRTLADTGLPFGSRPPRGSGPPLPPDNRSLSGPGENGVGRRRLPSRTSRTPFPQREAPFRTGVALPHAGISAGPVLSGHPAPQHGSSPRPVLHRPVCPLLPPLSQLPGHLTSLSAKPSVLRWPTGPPRSASSDPTADPVRSSPVDLSCP